MELNFNRYKKDPVVSIHNKMSTIFQVIKLKPMLGHDEKIILIGNIPIVVKKTIWEVRIDRLKNIFNRK